MHFIAGVLNPSTLNNKSVALLQIRETLLIWSFYLLLLHGIRLISGTNSTRFKALLTSVLIYVIILQVLVLFWSDMVQNDSKIFGINFDVDPNYEGEGAGIRIFGDLIIYSSGHTFLRDMLSSFVSLILLYSYLTVKPVHPTNRIIRAHRIWKLVSFSLVMIALFDVFLWRFIDIRPTYAAIFIFISAIGIVIVSLRYPEAVLLSHSQVYRVSNLYDLIEELGSANQISNRTRELIDYLETLPSVLTK